MLRMTPLKQALLAAVTIFVAMALYTDWRVEVGPDQVVPILVKFGQVAIFFFVIFWVIGHALRRVMLAMKPLGSTDKDSKADISRNAPQSKPAEK